MNFSLFDDEAVFQKNEFMKSYIELLTSNNLIKHIKFKTCKHHIIPKTYYKIKNIPIDNSIDNLVILSHKNHLLAHYYLCKFVIDSELLYRLECAFSSMCNELNIDKIDLIANDYQKIMEHCLQTRSERYKGRPGYKRTPEQIKAAQIRCKNQHKGFIWIYNPTTMIRHYIDPKDRIKYPDYELGRGPMSFETRQKLKMGQQSKLATEARKKGQLTRYIAKLNKVQNGDIVFSRKLCKKVICIELDKEFGSIKEAQHWAGSGDIQACCNHRQRVACNYHWAFADDVEYIIEQRQHLNYIENKNKKLMSTHTKSGKSVLCVELDRSFSSVTDAKKWLIEQNKRGDIYGAIKYGTAAGSYHWQRIDS